jgi:hypothetical protein
LFVAFRPQRHINSVLAHFCGSLWIKIEEALRSIVDPATQWPDLSIPFQNLLELTWVERGGTSRILKPQLREHAVFF